MAEAYEADEFNIPILYAFRFAKSGELVQLTQAQLDQIPYLAKLVINKDNFASSQNENHEYILHDPIEYIYFMVVFNAVTSKQPYELFSELSENYNIFHAIELLDYLNIDLFPLPLLKGIDLVISNPIQVENGEIRIMYHKATPHEAYLTAAEFIVALAKNQYNLNDTNTLNEIYCMIKTIVSNRSLFTPRFRHHSIVVARRCCYSLFSKTKQRHLPTIEMLAKQRAKDKSLYTRNHSYYYFDKFYNPFAWRGTYVSQENKEPISLSANVRDQLFATLLDSEYQEALLDYPYASYQMMIHSWKRFSFDTTRLMLPDFSKMIVLDKASELWYRLSTDNCTDVSNYIDKIMADEKKAKTELALLRRFNKQHNRPKVDKFKNRFGPKDKKYR